MQETPSVTGRTNLALTRAIYVLLGVAILRLWVMRLNSSFWLDETGTYWAVKDGLGQIYARMIEWPVGTPVYLLVAGLAHAIGGAQEWVMRLPSLLAVAVAAVVVYRLAVRLFGPESALPAAALFVCADTVTVAASDARSYGLLLLGAAGSTLALVRWLNGNSRRDAVVYAIAAAFTVHMHYLAFPMLLGHAAYALARWREGGPVRMKQISLAAVAVGILLLPLAPLGWSIFTHRGSLSWAPKPPMTELANQLTPSAPIFAAAVGLLLAWQVCRPLTTKLRAVGASTIVLLAASALLPPLILFGISTLTSTHIFVPRYFIESQVPLALLGGWAVGRLEPADARSMVTGSILVYCLMVAGSWGHWMPLHLDEDWRGALAAVAEVTEGTEIPVLAQCGFIEASAPGFDFGGPIPSYLTAPFDLYPTGGVVVPVPGQLDEGSVFYLNSRVAPILEKNDRFVFVNRGSDVTLGWIVRRFPGYAVEPLGNFGRVGAYLFHRGSSSIR